ncbi:TetR family transcriptional regulator [Gordonia sp. TBRC 11910]|uniref:TetR family transcriptional regulator n=1 Tax=Gordonia asplenii TaxID=2725283 RepID=A0A848KSJ9_9ACTN|nr:TetR family transcriptional regulator [Gordonia asplenii]NMO01242.1 TetR family transcriptional regulator [Gordonia asplenii]
MPADSSAPITRHTESGVRRRPADRRRSILDAAAHTFSARGYHSAKLDAIAREVGISVPALYRHFPTKYALFAETSRLLADEIRTATADISDAEGDPAETLGALLRALVGTTLSNRGSGLYRWQSQFLEPDDAAFVHDVAIAQHRRIRATIAALRAQRGLSELSKAQADAVAAAAVSAAGSPSTHRAPLPAKQIEQVLVGNALTMAALTPPEPAAHSADTTGAKIGLVPASKREVILRQSIPLFAQHGFREVSVDDIASSAGIPASGVYRHYSSKAAILETAFWRANDRMITAIDDALAQSQLPTDAVSRLVHSYVELCSDSTQLITVYMTELSNVGDGQQSALRRQQRRNIDEWASWVVQARADVTLAQARFMVHAALNIAGDLTRIPHPVERNLLSALIIEFLLGATPSPDH